MPTTLNEKLLDWPLDVDHVRCGWCMTNLAAGDGRTKSLLELITLHTDQCPVMQKRATDEHDPREGKIVKDSVGMPHPFDGEFCNDGCQPDG